jgi:hypothetical protein
MGLLVHQMRGDVSMNLSRTKRAMTGGAFALVFLFSVGIMTGTTAQAQDRDRNNRWDRSQRENRTEQRSQTVQRDRNRDGDWNRQQTERAREIERARQLAWQRQQERNRYAYSYPRTYPSYGGYGNGGYENGGYGNGGYRNGGSYGGYGGGYNNGEVQRGYYDGLNRGQEDARDRRSPNPNNSSHFRSGNSAYREGFVRGYQAGYRQYGGGRRF